MVSNIAKTLVGPLLAGCLDRHGELWTLIALYFFGLKLHIETGAPTYTWIIYANIPYLLWATFATGLQITITYLNKLADSP